MLPKYGKTRTRLNEWLEVVEEDVKISMELDSTEMMKHFVIARLGVSFVAVSNCREEIAAGKLRSIPLAPEPMMRRLGLITARTRHYQGGTGIYQIVLDNVGEESGTAKEKPPRVVA